MPDDRPVVVSSNPRMRPEDIARQTFGTVRRGYDPSEVRKFLEDVSREFALGVERDRELQRALAEAQHQAANPVLDEATLTSEKQGETTGLKRSAREGA